MKQLPIFITGNQNKADYLARLLDIELEHQKLDLDEIQSLDLKKIVEHKARQAYETIQSPVLVEDVSLAFTALNGLPGPFIKFFVEDLGLEATCKLLDGFADRSAVARCAYGYFDGVHFELFEGEISGSIAQEPSEGKMGFGWDRIFIPDGYRGITRSELDQENYDKLYQIIKPIDKVRDFLNQT